MFNIFKNQKDKKVFTYKLNNEILEFNEGQRYDICSLLTDKFIFIGISISYGMNYTDYNTPNILLSPNIDNKTIGENILLALSKSRTITKEEYLSRPELSNIEVKTEKYKEWYNNLMQKYEYKTKKALYKNMKNCWVTLLDKTITIIPSNHDRLDGWSGDGISESDYVILSLDNTPEEIGTGLRLAFDRCI